MRTPPGENVEPEANLSIRLARSHQLIKTFAKSRQLGKSQKYFNSAYSFAADGSMLVA